MIIVKTTNGDVLINEKAIQKIVHNKKKQLVMVFALDGCVTSPNIEDVEEVFYTNDMQAFEYRDKGSKIEKLKKELDEHLKWGNEIRTKYMELDKENDQLKAEVENLKNRIKTVDSMNAKSAPKHKISLRATSPIGSDCTQAFDVENCDGMTVKNFILNVINNDPYVTIDIMRDGKYIWNGKFTNQEIQAEHSKAIPEGMYGMKVKSAIAAGGWGQMSYNVKLYDQNG